MNVRLSPQTRLAQDMLALIQPRRLPVPCRSIFTKIACCVPMIGDFAQYISEKRLEYSLQKILLITPDAIFCGIKHLKTANSLSKAGICRGVISIAILITGLALGVITVGSACFGLLIEAVFIINCELNIQKNKKQIKTLNARWLNL